MIGLKERFAELNVDSVTANNVNNYGIKLLSEIVVYRGHLIIPTSSPDKTLFGFRFVSVMDGEDLDLDQIHATAAHESLELAIALAKKSIDEFFEHLKGELDSRSLHLLKHYSDEEQENILKVPSPKILDATEYLLSSEANKKHLERSIAQSKRNRKDGDDQK